MHIAVVGSGPAGLTAAYRLQQAGHIVEVLEARDVIGGRTHAAHFGPGHHCDTGAGWLANFYTHTLRLFDELGLRDVLLQPRQVRGAADLLVDGQLYPWPSRIETVRESTLLSAAEKERVLDYYVAVGAAQSGDLAVDLRYDDHDAARELRPLGDGVFEFIMRSMFEGPFFTRLDHMSATMVRAWLRSLQDAVFFQVRGGMDAPWLRLAESLDVKTNAPVKSLRRVSNGVELHGLFGARRYDGVVLAVPAPAAVPILAQEPDLAPPWLADVPYAPQVRVYAARRTTEDAHFGVHVVPPTEIFSVEHYSGQHGAWGACPPDWQWGLVCTYGPTCTPLLDQPVRTATQTVWDAGRAFAPDLFALEEADVVHPIRWEWAVPIMGPGHFRRLADHQHRPPVVFAGDWMCHACVEGAVRSGEAAAAAIDV